jgi:hypothetical protein
MVVGESVIAKWMKEFVEKGAALEHERWAKWQAYMHSKFVEHSDGKGDFVCLPVEFYKRWERQIATPYSELTEPEKESDREQVRPYIPLIEHIVFEAIKNSVKNTLQASIKKGHNDDCVFCGMKDKMAQEIIDRYSK